MGCQIGSPCWGNGLIQCIPMYYKVIQWANTMYYNVIHCITMYYKVIQWAAKWAAHCWGTQKCTSKKLEAISA